MVTAGPRTIQLRPMRQVAALYAGDVLLARIILRWCSDETDQEAGGSWLVLARVVAPTCGELFRQGGMREAKGCSLPYSVQSTTARQWTLVPAVRLLDVLPPAAEPSMRVLALSTLSTNERRGRDEHHPDSANQGDPAGRGRQRFRYLLGVVGGRRRVVRILDCGAVRAFHRRRW